MSPNLVNPTLSGKAALGYLSMLTNDQIAANYRMLSYYTQITIGEATQPPKGRGRKRKFSIKDVAIMGTALRLSTDLGLSPEKTREAGRLLQEEAWAQLFCCIDGVQRLWLVGRAQTDGTFDFYLGGGRPLIVGPCVLFDVSESLRRGVHKILSQEETSCKP